MTPVMKESEITSLKKHGKIPLEVKCIPVFHKVWRYRTVIRKTRSTKIVWSSLPKIYVCSACKMWSAYKDTFNAVCSKRNRRKKERRRDSNGI
jgi:hypothetical protein